MSEKPTDVSESLSEFGATVLNVIGNFEVGRIAATRLDSLTKTEYSRLYEVAQRISQTPEWTDATLQVKAFDQVTREGEDAWMTTNHADNPSAKTKGGKFKYRTFLPKAYSSAKSVIRKGLLYGNISPTASMLGKTALEAHNRSSEESGEGSETTNTLTPLENASQAFYKAAMDLKKKAKALESLYCSSSSDLDKTVVMAVVCTTVPDTITSLETTRATITGV